MSVRSAARRRSLGGTFIRKWLAALTILVISVTLLVIGLFGADPRTASAVAAPVSQCNSDFNVGGQGIACTVTIDNFVTGTGSIVATAPSTVTTTVCVGAAGTIAAGGGTCTTTTTTSAEPVTLVQQCNGSGNGGGGVVLCEVTVTNHFSASPAAAPTPATVYQCVGSEITGTAAPGICTPVNTPGVNSVTAATVGQCNSSGNGGGTVVFTCIVTAGSTMTSTLPVNIDQCNGSANGGGALLECTATVTNQVTPGGSPTASPSVSASGTASPSVAASASASPSGTVGLTPSPSVPSGASATPPSATPSTTVTTGATPTSPSTPAGPAPAAPRAGNGAGSSDQSVNMGFIVAGLAALSCGLACVALGRRRP